MEVVHPSDGEWGRRRVGEDGSEVWTGMVGQLRSGEADVCGASLTVTAERSEAIDFTVGFLEDVVSLIVVNPAVVGRNQQELDLMVFLTVFTGPAWIGILGVAVLSAVVHLSTTLALDLGGGHGRCLLQLRGFVVGIHRFFLSLIQRNPDTGEGRQSAGARALLLTVSLVAFFLFSFYGGDLTATMTAGVRAPSLRNFQDVLDTGYKVYSNEGASSYSALKNAKPGSIMSKIYNRVLGHIHAEDFTRQQLENPSKAAYFGSEFIVLEYKRFLFLRNFDDSLSTQLAFGLRKNSEFREIFDYHLIKFRQSGMLELLEHKWLDAEKPDDWSHRIFQEDAIPLGYENLFFPTAIMLGGVSVGMLILCAECVLHKRS